MPLAEQVSQARIGQPADLNHALINLNELRLPTKDFRNLSQKEAIQKCLEERKPNDVSGFTINYRTGTVRILSLKTAHIPSGHPQIVQIIGKTGFGIMRSHLSV